MHVCCGGSLQKGTKIIAIFEMALCIFIIGIGSFSITGGALLALGKVTEDTFEDISFVNGTTLDMDAVKAFGVIVLINSILTTAVFVINLLINIILLIGAEKRNRTLCIVWMILTAIRVVSTIVATFVGCPDFPTLFVWLFTIGKCVWTLWTVYFMWVVSAFISELKKDAAISELKKDAAISELKKKPRHVVTPSDNNNEEEDEPKKSSKPIHSSV